MASVVLAYLLNTPFSLYFVYFVVVFLQQSKGKAWYIPSTAD
jgi:hypothetical protein